MSLFLPQSKITYSSFYRYNPHQKDTVGREAKTYISYLKQDRIIDYAESKKSIISVFVSRLQKEIGASQFLIDSLNKETTLVPAVGHAPQKESSTLSVPKRICDELLVSQLAKDILPCLERKSQVTKSSTAAPGDRPSVSQHYETIEVRRTGLPLGIHSFTIVDDVTTRGATMYAMYKRLTEEFPNIPVNCFSLFRVDEEQLDSIKKMIDPHSGEIVYQNGKTHRT